MPLAGILGIFLFLSGIQPITPSSALSLCTQDIPDSILGKELLDVNQDGHEDEVIVYVNGNDVWLEIDSYTNIDCNIALQTELPFYIADIESKAQIIGIHMVEVTGDTQPELYIGVEQERPESYGPGKLHMIYRLNEEEWQEIFRLGQCSFFTLFEFRENPTSIAKDIYTYHDIQCAPPFASPRHYNLLRWNGADFVVIETGEIKITDSSELIWTLLCPGLPLLWLLSAAIIVLVTLWRRSTHRETPVPEKPVL